MLERAAPTGLCLVELRQSFSREWPEKRNVGAAKSMEEVERFILAGSSHVSASSLAFCSSPTNYGPDKKTTKKETGNEAKYETKKKHSRFNQQSKEQTIKTFT